MRFKRLIFERYNEKKHNKDIMFLAEYLRIKDKEEVFDMGFDDISKAIFLSIKESKKTYVVKDKYNTPIWIFGVSREKDNNGRGVWLVGTDRAGKYKKEFVYYSKKIIKHLIKKHGTLYNFVPCDYRATVRWLECLGAVFPEKIRFQKDKNDFYLFKLGG